MDELAVEMPPHDCGCKHTEPCGGPRCECASTERTQRQSKLPAVMIVDDDPDFLSVLEAALLQTDRCRVITASTAAEAVNVLKTTAVSMVIADHYLGGPTGTGLLEHMISRYPGVSRVIMSGRATRTVLAGAINRACAHQFLPKSMAPHLMVKRILQKLSFSRAN